MTRLAILAAACACLLVQSAAARICDAHTDEVRIAGAAMKKALVEMHAAEARFHEKNTEYEEFRDAPMQWGTSRIVDEELRLMRLELDQLVTEWSVQETRMLAADDVLGAAVDAHEAACGAEAQTAALLNELNLIPSP